MNVMVTRLPNTERSVMFGASHFPSERLGEPLESLGYREEEFLFSGDADLYRHNGNFIPEVASRAVPFVTRIVVRAPERPQDFSGVVHVEPLHPDLDGAVTWRMLAPYLVRHGHAYIGVSVFAGAIAMLRDLVDPVRYQTLTIAEDGHAYDIFARFLIALRNSDGIQRKLLGGCRPERVYISGWSATGSFCRIFMNEGFHQRARKPDGRPCVDGALIAIASGARSFGYPPLSAGSPTVPVGAPRRIVQPAGVPVIELLSEYEVETSATTWRPDADEPHDRYRQYHVAGASHSTDAPSTATAVARRQLELVGAPTGRCEINEEPARARLDCVARAVAERLHQWADAGVAPPRMTPFGRLEDPDAGPRGIAAGALPLVRDQHGNVVGGVRTAWTNVPAATYLPHSTPKPGRCEPSPFAPTADPASLADLRGHRRPFSLAKMREIYGSASAYRAALLTNADELVAEGWLLAPDATGLAEELAAAWPGDA